MIGTIRKHSSWLWIIIITATIVSFVVFFSPNQRSNNGVGSVDLGTLYGKKVTRQDYINARNEFYFFYFFHNGTFPDKDTSLSQSDLQREIYMRILLARKAESLGIHIGDDEAAKVASQMLRSIGPNGQDETLPDFVQRALKPEGLTASDFEYFVRQDLSIQQLVETLGLSGALVTPQDAAISYERAKRPISTEVVFFSASNYLSKVTTTPEAVAQYYTNYQAAYRLPDRVQVNYVEFGVSNYIAQAKADWAKTNFDAVVDQYFAQGAGASFPDAKTPDEAKAKIRDYLIRQKALSFARAQANDFANTVFAINPPTVSGFNNAATQAGFKALSTAPFGSRFGPSEFTATDGFVKAAFALTPEEPFAGPIAGYEAIYVIVLTRQLPSEVPALVEIENRVTKDYQMNEATALAQSAGTNFAVQAAVQSAAGKSFSAICAGAGLQPQVLPKFSLDTQSLPELGEHSPDLIQIKQAAFSTQTGGTSGFEQTSDGGFVLHVLSRLPVDDTAMKTELPQFTENLRRQRQSDAFNKWLQMEANTQLRTTPVYSDSQSQAGK